MLPPPAARATPGRSPGARPRSCAPAPAQSNARRRSASDAPGGPGAPPRLSCPQIPAPPGRRPSRRSTTASFGVNRRRGGAERSCRHLASFLPPFLGGFMYRCSASVIRAVKFRPSRTERIFTAFQSSSGSRTLVLFIFTTPFRRSCFCVMRGTLRLPVPICKYYDRLCCTDGRTEEGRREERNGLRVRYSPPALLREDSGAGRAD